MTTAQAILPKGNWKSDPVHSSVGFSVKHMGAGTFRGSFDDYRVALTADDDGELRLIGSAAVDSVDVKDENLKGHLLSPEFFDVERNPEITFVTRDVRGDDEGVVVEGDLTVKGITRAVEARGSISGPVQAPPGQRIGVDLETVVDRHDFGLDWNADLPDGGKVLGDDVTLSVHLELSSEE
jgi:polyisoprenoid-binding protein YceI